MKKLVSLALAATLLLALAACGKPYAPAPNPPLVLGEKFLLDLDYEQALLQFDQAIVIDPKNPRGYLGKADALLHLDRLEDAAAALGAGARAVPRAQRVSLREAQAEAEKSVVDGYIGLSSAYEKLGWRGIALALLKRVCEEFPEESRLGDALERLSAAINIDRDNNADTVSAEVPDNVFGMKDVLECGITLDSDAYAIANKMGVSHNRIFFSEVNLSDVGYNDPYIECESNGKSGQAFFGYPVNFPNSSAKAYFQSIGSFSIANNLVCVNWQYNNSIDYPSIMERCQFVRGIGLGMRDEDILRTFYYSDNAVIIENGTLKGNYSSTYESLSRADLYSFLDGDQIGYLERYNDDSDWGYYITYVFTNRNADVQYTVRFATKDGIVQDMSWTVNALSYDEEAQP